MTWFKVDDQFHDHPKVRKLRHAAARCNALQVRGVTPDEGKAAAMGVWVACGSWSGGTLSDGFVPDEVVARFDPSGVYAQMLVEVGLWVREKRDEEEGYSFHGWDDHQPTREKVLKERADTRDRVARHRAAKKAARETAAQPPDDPDDGGSAPSRRDSNGATNGVGNGVSNSVPTRPDPTRSKYPRGTGGSGSSSSVGGDLGGRARTREEPPRNPRCPQHQNLADDDPGPNCIPCRDARLQAERAASTARQDQLRVAAMTIRRCPDCDADGWRFEPGTRVPMSPYRRCDHQPLRDVS